MLLLEIIILAVIQGIAEFLPISSSGHVVVGAALFDQLGHPLAEKLTVNVVLHLGTLLAIIVFYWRRIIELLGRDARVIPLILVGSIPAAAVGFLVKKTAAGEVIELFLQSALIAGLMFPITGLMLLWAAKHARGTILCREMSWASALLIGAFQAFAILPGISRSGATIAAGLSVGLKRDEAAAFSFLLAIPAIAGAGLLEFLDALSTTTPHMPLGTLAAGLVVSFLVGLAALWWLIKWLDQGRIQLFAWYVIPLGVAVVTWQFLR